MSDLPSSSDDYAATDATPLSKAVWNAVFGSVGARLRALEAVEASFQSLIDLGTTQALETIAANIEPELAAARAALQTFMEEAAAAEDVVAAIANGTLPASSVSESAERIWLTPTLRDLWNARQPGDPTLTALAAVDVAADRLIYATGADAFATTALTAFARTLLAKVDAAAMREVIGAADADATSEALALRLRLDAEMTTTEAQRSQGRSTLGLGAAALLAVGTAAGQAVVRNASGTIDGLSATTEFTASGTWTKPTSLSASSLAIVALSGGGGGGGAGGNGYSGGGGGGGGGLLWIGPASLLPASAAVTIGAGGAGGTATAAGASGGATSFGALFAASGGSPGGQQSSVTVAGGGPGGVGTSTLAGGLGSAGVASTVKLSGSTSVAGGAGAGGGAGGAASSTTVGGAGGLGGGGGGGGSNASSASGGAGGAGHCRVTIIG